MADENVPGTWEEVFEHPRFKQLVAAKNELETKLKAQTDAHAKTLDDLQKQLAATNQGSQSKVSEMEAALAKLTEQFEGSEKARRAAEANAMRLKVATDLGIPDWASDLRGDDEASIREHAETVAQRITARLESSTPGIAPRGGGKPAPAITPTQLNDAAWVRENKSKLAQAAENGSL